MEKKRRLVFFAAQFLHVNGVLLGQTLQDAGLVKLLACAELRYNAGPLELSLEFLKGALKVRALFYGYYDDLWSGGLFCCYFYAILQQGAKLGIKLLTRKFIAHFLKVWELAGGFEG